MNWLLLILSLPTENATARMRAWRALKSSGAAVLRDGVYLLPTQENTLATLSNISDDVRDNGGIAYLVPTGDDNHADFTTLFDRSADFGELIHTIDKHRAALSEDNIQDTLKQTRRLRKSFAQIASIDFFPKEAQKQTDAALQGLEMAISRTLSPNEPHFISSDIPVLPLTEYLGRVWATRARPWVDRLACAWLIRRFIDCEAVILWLASPDDCPPDALGFDFDGASFSHVGNKVTFETLLASFDLETPALQRLGSLIHFLDVGGIQSPEAEGVERVLAGLRDSITDDDLLLAAASHLFDGLLNSFGKTDHSLGSPTT